MGRQNPGFAQSATELPARARLAPPVDAGPSPPMDPQEHEPCGKKPPLGPMDGEVIGSERFLAQTANDPDSVDVENCTAFVMSEAMCWTSVCNVRQKNAFGALVLSRVRFHVMKGVVISAKLERLPR